MMTIKAFTILELLVVLIISSILIVLISVSYNNFFKAYVEQKSLINQSVDRYYNYSLNRESILDKKLGEYNFIYFNQDSTMGGTADFQNLLQSDSNKVTAQNYEDYFNQLIITINQESPVEKLNEFYK